MNSDRQFFRKRGVGIHVVFFSKTLFLTGPAPGDVITNKDTYPQKNWKLRKARKNIKKS